MFKELKNEYPSFTPPPKNGGLLTPWAEQGVLLLNTCLTVRAHEANSHAKQGWEQFTQKVIDLVAKVRSRGVVFLAWGSPAQKRCAGISGGRHLVLKSVHPSPLSAERGWFGCGHFKEANEWLEQRYGEEGVINWDLNVEKPIKGPEAAKSADGQDDESVKAKGSTTSSSKVKSSKPAAKKDDFDDDDQDAIDALEELAKSDAIEPPTQETVESAKEVEKEEAESEAEDKENKKD